MIKRCAHLFLVSDLELCNIRLESVNLVGVLRVFVGRTGRRELVGEVFSNSH